MPFRKLDKELLYPSTAPRRMSVLVDGGDKDGKTTFGLSFPKPIYLINTNYGYEGLPAMKEAIEQGDVHVADWALPEEFVLAEYEKVLRGIDKDITDALVAIDANKGGTLMVDKADEVWGIVGPAKKAEAERRRYEEWEKGDQKRPFKKMQTDYQDPNLMMRAIYLRPLQYQHANAVWIHGTKREWKEDGSGPTGRLVYHGFSEAPGLVQMHVRLTTERVQIEERTKSGEVIPTGRFKTEQYGDILLCRFDRTKQGKRFSPPFDPTWEGLMEVIS